MAVTLINVFSVPTGKEDEFVKWWHDVKRTITGTTWIHQRKVPPEHQTGQPLQLH